MHGRCSTELSERLSSLITPTGVTTNAHMFTIQFRKPRTEEFKRDFVYRKSKKWNSLNKLNFPVAYNMKKFKAAVNLYLKDRALGTEAQTTGLVFPITVAG